MAREKRFSIGCVELKLIGAEMAIPVSGEASKFNTETRRAQRDEEADEAWRMFGRKYLVRIVVHAFTMVKEIRLQRFCPNYCFIYDKDSPAHMDAVRRWLLLYFRRSFCDRPAFGTSGQLGLYRIALPASGEIIHQYGCGR